MIARGTAALSGALVALAPPAHAQSTRFCSVFDGRCTPAFCSAYQDGVCIPDYGFPIGQDLRLTIETRASPPEKPDDVNTVPALFRTLRACFVPPRWTYTSPDTPSEARQLYRVTR